MEKPNRYWTYEKCKEVALDCSNRNELCKKYRGAYKAIYKNKWFELLVHMKVLKKPNGYWNYEKCKEIVNNCKDKNDLSVNYASAYNSIIENKWKDLLKYLSSRKKPDGYWTYEKCKEASSICSTKGEFQKRYSTAYSIVLKNKWQDLTQHMEIIGNKVKRLIYVYEFNDNHCYIGLTGNKNRRHLDHFKDETSSVYKHYIKTGIEPKLHIKTDYIDVKDAILMEEKILNEYKENNWVILNQIKTGGVGSNDIKWNKENCRKEALKYNNASHFNRGASGAYKAAVKYNWLDEFFPNTTKNGYWNNKELCREEAKKYKNRSEFCYGSWSAYYYSNINNWLDEFFVKHYKSTI